ncbi:hypothetical protein H4R20_000277 [Coemansia guatemalensis]|uniref:Uncharacterized protein n=1 Tax=Coemansia guatemalensis TaxID=2761395 RepID=A0A9W8I1C0_9FUNG|nr:hypothetical protein H4R20_000277 [Coemansia guatemalensis]
MLAVQPLVRWSTSQMGRRMTMVAGAAASSGGLLTAAYAEYLWQQCLAQGLLIGIGAGTIISAVSDLVPAAALVAGAAVGGSVLALATGHAMTEPATVFRWLALGMAIGQLIAVILVGHQRLQISKTTPKYSGSVYASTGLRAEPRITTSTTCSSARASNRISLRRIGAALTKAAGDILFYGGVPQLALLLPSYAQLQLQASAEASAALLAVLLAAVAGGALTAHTSLQHVHAAVVAAAAQGVAGLAICLWLLPIRGWPAAVVLSVCSGLALGAAISCVAKRSRPWKMLLADAVAVFAGAAISAQLLRQSAFTPALAFSAAACLAAAALTAASAFLGLELPNRRRC